MFKFKFNEAVKDKYTKRTGYVIGRSITVESGIRYNVLFLAKNSTGTDITEEQTFVDEISLIPVEDRNELANDIGEKEAYDIPFNPEFQLMEEVTHTFIEKNGFIMNVIQNMQGSYNYRIKMKELHSGKPVIIGWASAVEFASAKPVQVVEPVEVETKSTKKKYNNKNTTENESNKVVPSKLGGMNRKDW